MGALATLGRAIGLNVGFDKETKSAPPPSSSTTGDAMDNGAKALRDGANSTKKTLEEITGKKMARGGIVGKGVPAKPKMEGIGAGVPGFSGAGIPGKPFGKRK